MHEDVISRLRDEGRSDIRFLPPLLWAYELRNAMIACDPQLVGCTEFNGSMWIVVQEWKGKAEG